MSTPPSQGLERSVKPRRINLSRQSGDVFDVVLMRDGIERLHDRLTRNPHPDALVLKGAVHFAV